MIFFSDFHWHDLGVLGKIFIFLGFLGKIICQDLDNKCKKFKILARKLRCQALGGPLFLVHHVSCQKLKSNENCKIMYVLFYLGIFISFDLKLLGNSGI